MAALNPYINFNGNCAEAFDFYKSVFGGQFAARMTFGDTPKDSGMPPVPDIDKNRLMHVSLPVGNGTVLMGSDRVSFMGPGVTGDNFAVSINTDSRAEADKLFNGLSAGGKATMPLIDAFWGAYFGMFTDKFGIQWMVNCEKKA
jgi:PhnB protein